MNRLLEKHISKFLTPDLMQHPNMSRFLNAVNESYEFLERDYLLIERAFKLTEEEFKEINEKLNKEIEIKNDSVAALLSGLDEDIKDEVSKKEDALSYISGYINTQLNARKNAEKIFSSLIDFDHSAVVLRGANDELWYINDLFIDLFSIPLKAEEAMKIGHGSFRDRIVLHFNDPKQADDRIGEILNKKELVLKERVEMCDGKIYERDYIPIFIDGEYKAHLWKFVDKTELYKAKEAISNFRLTNEKILNASLDGIAILNEDEKIEFWNQQAEKIFGWSEKEVLQKELLNVLKPTLANEEKGALGDLIKSIQANEKSNIVELSFTNKFGSVITVELFVMLIKQAAQYERWCFFRDISERKHNEERLAISQNLLRQCQELAHIGSWEHDFKENKVRWTDEMFRIRGLEINNDESSLELFEQYIHPEDIERVKGSIAEALEQKVNFDVKYRIIRPNGEVRILHDIGQPVLNKLGDIIKIQGTGQDVTESERVAEALILQRKFTDDILNHLPADIVVFDPNHKYLFINPFGIKDTELRTWLIGKDDFDYCNRKGISDSIAMKRRVIFKQAVKTGMIQEWMDEQLDRQGNTRYILRKLYPYFENGKLKYMFGYGTDITERKLAENRLSEALLATNKSNMELERFAYVASHDLQEPLRMVSSFLKLLENKYKQQLDDTAIKYIDFAIDGSERMKDLIQALLQYSRFGYSKEAFSAVSLDEVLNELKHILNEKIKESGAKLIIPTLPAITANRTQLKQLFQNLILNALKYNDKEVPQVEIHFSEDAINWHFEVRDNGIGIEKKYFEKIFVIFQRLHGKTDFSGTGIGLSICQKIVENHKGQIRVESEPGKGSSFHFSISKLLKETPPEETETNIL